MLYIAYATPYGVKLRQTFEPAFARYDFGPNAPLHGAGGPNMTVAVSAPQKVNVAQQPRQMAMAAPGAPTARRITRDLVFKEEDDEDVNTKSQKTNGDEPFVATYELAHN